MLDKLNNAQQKAIEQFAFSDCKNFTTITLPKSVTSMGISVFSGCSSLTSVYYRGDVPSVRLMLYGGTTPNSLISHYPEGNVTWEAEGGRCKQFQYLYPEGQSRRWGERNLRRYGLNQ